MAAVYTFGRDVGIKCVGTNPDGPLLDVVRFAVEAALVAESTSEDLPAPPTSIATWLAFDRVVSVKRDRLRRHGHTAHASSGGMLRMVMAMNSMSS